jgi:UDP-N-acetylmuramoylalanine--D-glutamate ligase
MPMSNESATVMGLGRYGGGAGAARHLVSLGYDVLVTDMSPQSELAEAIDSISDLIDAGSVELRLGKHNVSDFTTCDLVVVNPAVRLPWENRFVRAAQAADVRLTTEIGLLLDAIPAECKIIGITGSAGKSTTSAMIHAGHIAADRPTIIGGNIGGSMLEHLDKIAPETTIVLELSSAMLWWLAQPGCIKQNQLFDAAVITNISPNHIDWHGDQAHYAQSKLGIADLLKPGGTLIAHPDIAIQFEPSLPIKVCDSLPSLNTPGMHNRINSSTALMACQALGAEIDRAAAGIAAFAGLPHRLELVRTHNSIRWFNDSKSTTPEATQLALAALQPSRVHLIVGGSDKGIDLKPIADLSQSAASLLCIGITGKNIAELAKVEHLGTLEAAVAAAHAIAKPGEAVVLSPGCASFDQFKNFEHRGNTFRKLVHSLA